MSESRVVRLIVLAMLLYLSAELAWRVAAFAGIALDSSSFGVGIALAVLIAFVWFRLDHWWNIFRRPYQPQVVRSQTRETPSQITLAALWALVKLIIVMAVLVALSAFFLFFVQ